MCRVPGTGSISVRGNTPPGSNLLSFTLPAQVQTLHPSQCLPSVLEGLEVVPTPLSRTHPDSDQTRFDPKVQHPFRQMTPRTYDLKANRSVQQNPMPPDQEEGVRFPVCSCQRLHHRRLRSAQPTAVPRRMPCQPRHAGGRASQPTKRLGEAA